MYMCVYTYIYIYIYIHILATRRTLLYVCHCCLFYSMCYYLVTDLSVLWILAIVANRHNDLSLSILTLRFLLYVFLAVRRNSRLATRVDGPKMGRTKQLGTPFVA